MSLDISLLAGKSSESRVYSDNYTGNVCPMWNKAGVCDTLYTSSGKKASEITEVIRKGITAMKADPDEYKKLNPDNGWGNYEGALKFLEDLLRNLEEWPDSTIAIF